MIANSRKWPCECDFLKFLESSNISNSHFLSCPSLQIMYLSWPFLSVIYYNTSSCCGSQTQTAADGNVPPQSFRFRPFSCCPLHSPTKELEWKCVFTVTFPLSHTLVSLQSNGWMWCDFPLHSTISTCFVSFVRDHFSADGRLLTYHIPPLLNPPAPIPPSLSRYLNCSLKVNGASALARLRENCNRVLTEMFVLNSSWGMPSRMTCLGLH